MRTPKELVGRQHLGSFLCKNWELRVTQRCLRDDLEVEASAQFKEIRNYEVVRAFVRERSGKRYGTRDVSQVSSGRVSVVAHQHRHRGGTWYDEEHGVIWLVAYGRHESGDDGDFFPYCRSLDDEDALLPTEDDYKALFDDRGHRFAFSLSVQAPALLKAARRSDSAISVDLGGRFGAAVAVEVAADLEATTIAIDSSMIAVYEQIPAILGAFHDGPWDDAQELPDRPLRDSEIGFIHHHER